jgi:cytochrome c biogenesis protein CcmG/thiol:disulfide interchange protein DsbE
MAARRKLSSLPLIAVVLCFVASALPLPFAAALDKGERAPEIDLADLSGNSVKLSALRGKVVLVDFWASWCAPCRDSLPVLDRLAKTYRDQGLVIVGVNIDKSAGEARAFLEKNKLQVSFPVVNDKDHKVAERYAPPTMPSSYLIDREGRVHRVHAGFRPSDESKLEAELKALLN